MRIGIDAHTIGSGMGGNENYAFHLLKALAEIDTSNTYILYLTQSSVDTEKLAAPPNFTSVCIRPHTPLVRIPFSLPLALARFPVDVLHVQYIAPPVCPIPVVNMVHDLAAIHYPQFFNKREHLRNRFLLPLNIRRAAKVLTVSEYCKNDIVKTYGVHPDKVVVTYPGVSQHFRPLNDPMLVVSVLHKYGISQPYLLFVGNIQPRKNLRGVIEAFRLLKRDHAIEHKLVVVGRKAFLYSDVFRLVRERALESQIIFTGYVPYEDLPALYNGAALLVYPSFFEGFGSPPIEAMACGIPVVASTAPCFPEILGKAAMLADPRSSPDIAKAIWSVLDDADLRRRLVAEGLNRARALSWEATARKTLAVCQTVVQQQRRSGR